jgi:glucosamine--fructose-6-phosphate aminotransferase (isomerizing)
VDDVAAKYNFADMQGNRAILQLRWATFGAPSQVNAQPHLDSDGDIVGAHNGNVVNNVELRQRFKDEGLTVRSENDGESCVHAVERYFDKGLDMITSIRRATQDLEGDYSFVVGRLGEDCIYALKMGSGMVVGLADDRTCVSSDLPSVLPITRQIMRVYDGEIVTLWADRVEIRSIESGEIIEREPEFVEDSMEAVQKGGYDHFMLKEIHEQPKVAEELLHLLENAPEVGSMVEWMKNARNLYLVACGTSYHACLAGAVFLSRLAGRVAIPILAPQFVAQYGAAITPDDVGVFVSQSGETKDVLNAIAASKEKGMGILGLVNVVGSTLTLVSETWLPLACGYEISVPATKTFTNQVLAFLFLALKMGGHNTRYLSKLPALMRETLENVDDQVRAVEKFVNPWDDLYILGYGPTYSMALEGALKLKEITYAHCEGMLSTEFKHGPLSAVTDQYPVIFVADPKNIPLILSGINEVTCRGAFAIVIGPDDSRLHANAHRVITIPETELEIFALLSILPLQLLSYYLSIARGYDPDFPRNLSKTLTVD